MTREEVGKKLELFRINRRRLKEDADLTEEEKKTIELAIEQIWFDLKAGGFSGNDDEGAGLKTFRHPEPGRMRISNLEAGKIIKKHNEERATRIKILKDEIEKLKNKK